MKTNNYKHFIIHNNDRTSVDSPILSLRIRVCLLMFALEYILL